MIASGAEGPPVTHRRDAPPKLTSNDGSAQENTVVGTQNSAARRNANDVFPQPLGPTMAIGLAVGFLWSGIAFKTLSITGAA